MDEDQKALLYLFERPFEPLKIPRAGGTVLFQQEGDEDEDLATLFSSKATLMNVPAWPDVDVVNELPKCHQVPKGIPYSHFDPVHRAAANELSQKFMDPEIADMKMCSNKAAAIKDTVNEGVFIYALSLAMINNPAINSRLVPAIYEVFPNKFIPSKTMEQCRDKVKSSQYKTEPEKCVVEHNIDFTGGGTDLNPEGKVAYYREDYGLNSHHWHWHLIFNNDMPRDRKGELFFYMHSQMVARYDWERLSNSLERVVALNNFREPIPDGYFPKLTVNNSALNYMSRPDNITAQTVTYRGLDTLLNKIPGNFDIDEMEGWRDNLYDAIEKGCMENADGEEVPLSDNVAPGEKRGIDILGDAFEADINLSVNMEKYGNLHNWGHVLVAFIHDPQGKHKAQNEMGVMGDSATASRDPFFWRWHKFIDEVFAKYKLTQDPYDDNELSFESVEVESVVVKSDNLEENVLETCWTYRTIEASRGLDFGGPPGLDFDKVAQPVDVKLQHITHRPFTYNIQVTNNQDEPVEVTVRLYMAPKLNETGETMSFMDQRLLWAEMDKYQTTLEPGSNLLERLSTESSITIPEERTFRELEENPPTDEDINYCGCGWPQHLLLPKGNSEGMDFQIFALVSNWELDKVEESTGENCCSNAVSYCGIMNEKFPDARPMGYPFDRKPNETVCDVDITDASDYANALSNACMSDIKIYFRDCDIDEVQQQRECDIDEVQQQRECDIDEVQQQQED